MNQQNIHSRFLGTLRQVFGYSAFRPGQEAIITSIFSGKDTLAILPTGGGKSICYQIPALNFSGLSVIISPLISLMKDQVETLQRKGISAACLNSTLSEAEQSAVLLNLKKGAIHLLYLSPERLTSPRFRSFVRASRLSVSFLCVDEAHCISQWGREFRPAYRHIADFINEQPSRPVVAAFTATAAPEVRDDIIRLLEMRSPAVFAMGFDRPNLYYEVRHVRQKWKELLPLLEHYRGQCGIIYALTRRTVEILSQKLQKEGIRALPYHGGMTSALRTQHQNLWLSGDVPLIVATNAFGMGIDKPNVRFVIHYNMPKDLESYYQEAGRAGRDGLPSDCILLVDYSDLVINRHFIGHVRSDSVRAVERAKLYAMAEYAGGERCLRAAMLSYFGQRAPSFCGHCSVCLKNGPFQKPLSREADTANLCRELRALRASLAKEHHLSAEKIMPDTALREMAERRPLSMADLLLMERTPLLPSIKYGADFLSEIRAWNHSHLS